MISPQVIALFMIGLLLLFFSVHIYMDIQMICSKRKSKIIRSPFTVPLYAEILAALSSIIFWIAFLASPFFLCSGFKTAFAPVQLQCFYENLCQSAGLLFMLAGVLLASWGRVSRGVIAPSGPMPEDYELSTRGAYAIIRHPLYASYFLFFIGLPLVLLNILLVVCIVGIPGYYTVAKMEEKMLIDRFGDEYREYQKRVGMFIPKILTIR